MKQLHNAQEAIRQVYESNIDTPIGRKLFDLQRARSTWDVDFPSLVWEWREEDFILLPLFWQALGKAREWGKELFVNSKYWDNQNQGQKDSANNQVAIQHAIEWFRTRQSNGDETKFWESLP